MKKLLEWDEIWYSDVFDVANHECKINIQKFKITDLIWLTKMQKIVLMRYNLVLEVVWRRRLRIRINIQKFKISDAIWGTKMRKAKSYAARVSLWHKFSWIADHGSGISKMAFKN